MKYRNTLSISTSQHRGYKPSENQVGAKLFYLVVDYMLVYTPQMFILNVQYREQVTCQPQPGRGMDVMMYSAAQQSVSIKVNIRAV